MFIGAQHIVPRIWEGGLAFVGWEWHENEAAFSYTVMVEFPFAAITLDYLVHL